MFSAEAMSIVERSLSSNASETQIATFTTKALQRGLNIEAVHTLRGEDFLEDLEVFNGSIEAAVSLEITRLMEIDLFKVPKINKKNSKSAKKKVRASYGIRDKRGRFISPINLARLINLSLDNYTKQLMGKDGRLNNRTGRLANSGRIKSIETATRGSYLFNYTYMTYPYEVFEPYGKKGSLERSPSSLVRDAIKLAIQDIVSPKTPLMAKFRWSRR